ncbi:glyoxylase-like metal-dependent hydrolase (beta-lactamase superfamily II) [Litorivivens lipolytica]|uniref:Glyoxylase-like metal-dependent hydrolase (Beta-lactamase superfamily II) n=1 Tax=Litorivivens lipolytica TaxID=1524264 RepID=A0A7W4W417_9GAMM|nr:MBL fold metallo-hydrolase [Litorivivens lipolytica]MBB3047004.1 glyoxylase-like metal-dependent hydrolase (beta-lactamase superfamily II) [Litorivivens lipolytica]
MPLIHKINHPQVEGIRVGRTGPAGNYRINTTCIVYRLGDTIIDTGPTKEWKTVKRFLDERGVRRALLTHYHEDHSGNCGHVQDCFNALVHSHTSNHDKLASGYDLNLFSKLIFGDITFSEASTFPETIETNTGQQLKALHMPGHSDDMTTLFEPNEGWLFSGDLYVSSKVRYAFREESVSEQIASLKAAVALDFDTLFCAHQGMIKEGKQALQKKLDHLSGLQQEVNHLHQLGWSEKAITRKLLGREDIVSWFSGFAMSKGNLVRACLHN